MSDFIVRFQGVDLSHDHANKIQSAIQQTVLTELSASSLAAYAPNKPNVAEQQGVAALLPLRWRGIIIIVQDELKSNPAILDAPLQVTTAV